MIISAQRCIKVNFEKITSEEMLEEISDKLIVYLKDGTLNLNTFIKKIDMFKK